MLYSVKIESDAMMSLPARERQNIRKVIHRTMAEGWHGLQLKEHFLPQAHFKYKHSPRSHKYLRSKGNKPDLVKSGFARDESLGNRKIRATQFEGQATISNTFNFRHPKSQVNMRQEVLTVLPGEANQLGRLAGKQLDRKLRGLSKRRGKVVVVKVGI